MIRVPGSWCVFNKKREEEKGKWEILGLLKRLFHSIFTKWLSYNALSSSLPVSSIHPAPNVIHSILPLIVSRELEACSTNYGLWRKVGKISHHTLLSIMCRYTDVKFVSGFSGFFLHCVWAPTCVPAEWVPPLQVCDSGKLCAKEKIVSGLYFICLYFIWFIWFLALILFVFIIWFVFILYIGFRNCLLFSISYCSLLCWIIWVPYLLNF